MAPRTVRAVVFDLFGTLIQNLRREEFEQPLSDIAETLSLSRRDFIRLWNESWERRSAGYFSSLEADIEHICRTLGTRPEADLLSRSSENLKSFARVVLLRVRDDAMDTLSLLRRSGYKTGLISNCAANIPSVWEETLLGHSIDSPIFSCSVGLRKPAREIYLLACEKMALSPNKCIYLADGNERELTGAVQAGMKGVLFRGPDEDPYDDGLDRKEWTGPAISELKEVIDVLHVEPAKSTEFMRRD